jgi:hypothetical protein
MQKSGGKGRATAIVDAHAHGLFKGVASAMPQISPAPSITKSSCTTLVKLSWAEASKALRTLSDGSHRRRPRDHEKK